jgi:hypothetical protein
MLALQFIHTFYDRALLLESTNTRGHRRAYSRFGITQTGSEVGA